MKTTFVHRNKTSLPIDENIASTKQINQIRQQCFFINYYLLIEVHEGWCYIIQTMEYIIQYCNVIFERSVFQGETGLGIISFLNEFN